VAEVVHGKAPRLKGVELPPLGQLPSGEEVAEVVGVWKAQPETQPKV
jgi:hypothetical protein